jgi:hypothetical protein
VASAGDVMSLPRLSFAPGEMSASSMTLLNVAEEEDERGTRDIEVCSMARDINTLVALV